MPFDRFNNFGGIFDFEFSGYIEKLRFRIRMLENKRNGITKCFNWDIWFNEYYALSLEIWHIIFFSNSNKMDNIFCWNTIFIFTLEKVQISHKRQMDHSLQYLNSQYLVPSYRFINAVAKNTERSFRMTLCAGNSCFIHPEDNVFLKTNL